MKQANIVTVVGKKGAGDYDDEESTNEFLGVARQLLTEGAGARGCRFARPGARWPGCRLRGLLVRRGHGPHADLRVGHIRSTGGAAFGWARAGTRAAKTGRNDVRRNCTRWRGNGER